MVKWACLRVGRIRSHLIERTCSGYVARQDSDALNDDFVKLSSKISAKELLYISRQTASELTRGITDQQLSFLAERYVSSVRLLFVTAYIVAKRQGILPISLYQLFIFIPSIHT